MKHGLSQLAVAVLAAASLVCSEPKKSDSVPPVPAPQPAVPAAAVSQLPASPACTVALAPAAPQFGAVVFDSALTDQARIYAGMLPLDSARYPKLTTGKGYAEHRRVFEKDWAKLDKRIQAMEQWRAAELAGVSTAGATLFYPFSGPDFLNADVFFPECAKSVYISLEKTGDIPSPDLAEKHFVNFTEDIRTSMSLIFQRNYFITGRMSNQFRTPYLQGNLTIFMVFLARRDCAIVSINKVHIDSIGTLVAAPRDTGKAKRKQIGGMEIQYVKARSNGTVRHLYYFPVDIQDSSLNIKPQLMTYLRSIDNMVVFAKAASYLMHGENFSMIRGICLRAKAILEDDTGVPYRFFKPGQWTVELYGHYTKPIKDFNYGFQTDLDSTFRAGKNVKPLPFNIGYHWHDSYSSLILAVRTPPAADTAKAPDTAAPKR
jgi:hypothetical protein